MDIRVQRSWMYDRLDLSNHSLKPDFKRGVYEFIEYATSQPQFALDKEIRCPCWKCKNLKHYAPDAVIVHLFNRGFISDYWYWTSHGEVKPPNSIFNTGGSTSAQIRHSENYNRYEEVVHDAMRGVVHNWEDEADNVDVDDLPNAEAQHFYNMLATAQRPLWEGCETQTELSAALQMMTLKSDYNMSQGCFNRMAKMMKTMAPQENCVPNSFYEAKKMVSKLGLSSVKIDCCKNGCMLYYKEDVDLAECKFCHEGRYKRTNSTGRGKIKLVPQQRMHYLPLIPRLKRLYTSMKSAPHMRWHFENKREEGVLCHPSDGLAWKNFDDAHPNFAAEPRNVRLGLCSDGFNPFNSSEPYSCWPVIVTPYNLPPEMCMTTPYMFLTCIIPGPKNPKSRIDVYLRPLIDELNELWEHGVETWDTSKKENFQLRAALMWTINDFPAYGMLSGWMTAGRLACPICMEHTKAFYLKYGRKISWFDCHRQFLPLDHPFRKSRDNFTVGRKETSSAPPRLNGHQIFDEVQYLQSIEELDVQHEKFEGYGRTHNWTKKSIFWELPYWKDNLVSRGNFPHREPGIPRYFKSQYYGYL